MDGALGLLSTVCFVAAVACALGSLVIGVRAWLHRWDERMGSWHRRAARAPDAPASTIRLPDERPAGADQFARN